MGYYLGGGGFYTDEYGTYILVPLTESIHCAILRVKGPKRHSRLRRSRTIRRATIVSRCQSQPLLLRRPTSTNVEKTFDFEL